MPILARRLIEDLLPTLSQCTTQTRVDSLSTLTSEDELCGLLDSVTDILSHEPAVLRPEGDVCVVGDIHGNLDALLRIFECFGYPPQFRYLFLGDYVDRGRNSCEVVFLLFALKVLFPESVYLLRGNHEFPEMASSYGFKKECERRFSDHIFERVMDTFQHLPVAAVIGQNFCVHGGLSPRLQHWHQISSIQKLPRSASSENAGDLALVWSDPSVDVPFFAESPRGCGFLYGEGAIEQFTGGDGVAHRIIRAHESCQGGVEFPIPESEKVVTLFSSCDYCQMGNQGAVALVRDQGLEIAFQQFPPITGCEREKRRVQFPEWMMQPEARQVDVDLFDDAFVDITL
jgi:protein phosphatase